MSDSINVYWGSCNEGFLEMSKSMWYRDPSNVYKRHANNKNADVPDNGTTMFMCPAVQDKLKNTWSFESAANVEIIIRDGIIESNSGIPLHPTPRQNSIDDTGHIWIDLGWLFFADQPLVASFTSPYFDRVDHVSKMSIPPAAFDIGSWFRPFNAEYIVWNIENTDINLVEGDPLFYVEFMTDKKVNLVRFEQSPKILEYATGCSKSTQFFGRGRGLDKRYLDFDAGHMRELILREIQKNVVG